MDLVLDSSAFFSMDNLPEGNCICPSGVIQELKKYKEDDKNLKKKDDPSQRVLGAMAESRYQRGKKNGEVR